MAALALGGAATVVWGARWLAFSQPELSMTDACAEGADLVAPLWPPWIVLVGLLAIGVVVTIRQGRNDFRMYLLLGLGALAVAFTFPGWVIILNGVGCAR